MTNRINFRLTITEIKFKKQRYTFLVIAPEIFQTIVFDLFNVKYLSFKCKRNNNKGKRK